MKIKMFQELRLALVVAVSIVLVCVGFLIVISEQRTGADPVTSPETISSVHVATVREDFFPVVESIRKVYEGIESLSFDGQVDIRIFSGNSQTTGNGSIEYAAQNNRYRYETTVPETLQQFGLMRDVETLYDGTKYYFFDKEARIVSFQGTEEVRLPNALPNPFFLQLDFLGNDDDQCTNCKMRLHDIKQSIRWPKRSSTIDVVSSTIENGVRHAVLEMEGGTVDDIEYKFRVRLVGPESDLRITEVSRLRLNGTPLVEVVFNDFRPVTNFSRPIPHRIEVAARNPDGSIALTAIYSLMNFRMNDAAIGDSFAPTFSGAEKYWNSDTKSFVQN